MINCSYILEFEFYKRFVERLLGDEKPLIFCSIKLRLAYGIKLTSPH